MSSRLTAVAMSATALSRLSDQLPGTCTVSCACGARVSRSASWVAPEILRVWSGRGAHDALSHSRHLRVAFLRDLRSRYAKEVCRGAGCGGGPGVGPGF